MLQTTLNQLRCNWQCRRLSRISQMLNIIIATSQPPENYLTTEISQTRQVSQYHLCPSHNKQHCFGLAGCTEVTYLLFTFRYICTVHNTQLTFMPVAGDAEVHAVVGVFLVLMLFWLSIFPWSICDGYLSFSYKTSRHKSDPLKLHYQVKKPAKLFITGSPSIITWVCTGVQ